MILNNISETFNGFIIHARGMHLIDMLEEIRVSVMERVHKLSGELRDYNHRICPKIVKKVKKKSRVLLGIVFHMQHLMYCLRLIIMEIGL